MDITIPIEDPSRRGALYGTADRNLRLIRASFDVRISARDNAVHISGPAEAVRKAACVIENLQRSLRAHVDVSDELVQESIELAMMDGKAGSGAPIEVFLSASTITPKGEGQQRYVEAIFNHDLTFCLGPAGTGKTFLAVAVSIWARVRYGWQT